MKFIADIHVHSHFSRATAKNLDLEHLYMAARIKGISLVGTGDFTHPGWVSELEEKLVPAEEGFFKLKDSIEEKLDKSVPSLCSKKVRFILQAEISNIYKKDQRVRKNHNLLFFPEMDLVKNFNARLDKIGNIKSDGRPILGLDAEKLLEIMLEISERGFFIPAHIWTPWFSMFGSKSGFDSIKECFGSLSNHIFAVETGLSSDPPMNWRVKDLDNVSLVSNSDAHSPGYLGRNASVFDTDFTYDDMRQALEQQNTDKYLGTIDMYPEEGKYHFDGHRKCNICFNPEQTLEHNGICPECGKPLTLGVLYRVQELASRPAGYFPENRPAYQSIIPLNDILSEILGVGPKTKKVASHYNKIIEGLGSELEVLLYKDINDIEKIGIPLLSEAIVRMRKGDIKVSPGFDGEYGKVRIFDESEKEILKGEQNIFFISNEKSGTFSGESRVRVGKKFNVKVKADLVDNAEHLPISPKMVLHPENTENIPDHNEEKDLIRKCDNNLLSPLNEEQKKAVLAFGHPVIIEAGPGTGKTMTLTTKIAWLITHKNISSASILALTFTNRAAGQMKERISALLGSETENFVCAATFHSFCLMILKEYTSFSCSLADDTTRKELLTMAFNDVVEKDNKLSIKEIDHMISTSKQRCLNLSDNLDFGTYTPEESDQFFKVWERYQKLLACQNLVDFEDLILMALNLFKSDENILIEVRRRFPFVFIDEYQDINKGQYLLAKILAGDGNSLFVIGDPDQSIYGFRGSDNKYFRKFFEDYPNAEKISLKKSYRSTDTILDASFQMITGINSLRVKKLKERIFSDITGKDKIMIMPAASERAEAVAVGKTIERLTGGISLFSMDAGKADSSDDREFAFSDFAVLYRTKKQGEIFAEAFEKAGIPFQMADREDLFQRKGIKEIMSIVKTITGMGSINDFINAIEVFCRAGQGNIGRKTKLALRQWLYSLEGFPGNALAVLSGEAGKFPLKVRKTYGESIAESACALLKLKYRINTHNESGIIETSDLIKTVAEQSGMKSLIDGDEKAKDVFNYLIAEAESFNGSLREFIDFFALKRDTEIIKEGVEKVSFMTMHASKGLEFPVVFVTGCEDGLIPFTYFDKNIADYDEERRLFYVAMTRAKEILCLTYAKTRRIYGKTVKCSKSPFLDDIETKLKNHIKNKAKVIKRRKKTESGKQLDLFQRN